MSQQRPAADPARGAAMAADPSTDPDPALIPGTDRVRPDYRTLFRLDGRRAVVVGGGSGIGRPVVSSAPVESVVKEVMTSI